MITDAQQNVIASISIEISNRLMALAMEETMPGHDADASDEKMKQARTEIIRLRSIRDDLENIFAGRSHYTQGAVL